MTDPHPDLPLIGVPGDACAACAAQLAADQRYCLHCGTRRAAPRLDPLAHARGTAPAPGADRQAGREAVAAPQGLVARATRTPAGLAAVPALRALGRPQVMATAATLVLGFGVAIGAAAGPPSASGLPLAGAPRILVAAPPATPATVPAPSDAAPDAGDGTATADAGAAPEPEPVAADASTSPQAPTPQPAASDDEPPADDGGDPAPATPAPPAPVKHVWLIVLREAPAAPPFGAEAPEPLAPDLVAQGTVLSHYASIAPGSLANRIAMISGQAPTAATLADCPVYAPVVPGTIAAKTGLVAGDGCLYPARTATLTGQLTGAGLAWKGYFEDMGAAPPPADTSCRRPQVGEPDPFAAPRPGDAYLTRSDPFVFFRGITESPDCGPGVVGLDRLAPDLASADQTPAFSFIAPSACHDGSAAPCAADAPAGLAAASTWLSSIVPQITASPAYADGGLIVITFDGAPRDPAVDPAAEPAGSDVGALLLSPYVAGGATVAARYDHRSLLKTIGRIFGLPALGHAADPGVHAFGATVFANAPGGD